MRIRGSLLYCKDDERSLMSLSGAPDGKTSVRWNPSQETSQFALSALFFGGEKQHGAVTVICTMLVWNSEPGSPVREALFMCPRFKCPAIPAEPEKKGVQNNEEANTCMDTGNGLCLFHCAERL